MLQISFSSASSVEFGHHNKNTFHLDFSQLDWTKRENLSGSIWWGIFLLSKKQNLAGKKVVLADGQTWGVDPKPVLLEVSWTVVAFATSVADVTLDFWVGLQVGSVVDFAVYT